MFRLVKNLYGGAEVAPPKDNFPFTAGEELSEGTVCKFNTDGKLVAADDDDSEAAIVTLSGAEADEDVRGYYILPGMIFIAPKDDDAHADQYTGNNSVEMNDDGTEVKVSQDPGASGGNLTLIKMDDDFAYVIFNKGVFFK